MYKTNNINHKERQDTSTRDNVIRRFGLINGWVMVIFKIQCFTTQIISQAKAKTAHSKAVEINESERVKNLKIKTVAAWNKTVEVTAPVLNKTAEIAKPAWEKTVNVATVGAEKTAEIAKPAWDKTFHAASVGVEKTAEFAKPAWEKTVEASQHARQRASTATSKLAEDLKPTADAVGAQAAAGWSAFSQIVTTGVNEAAATMSGEKRTYNNVSSDDEPTSSSPHSSFNV